MWHFCASIRTFIYRSYFCFFIFLYDDLYIERDKRRNKMNNFSSTGAATNRFTPSMFLTPQGNVYIIDSALEVANVPMGTGISVAICPTENLMYLKMYQNGAPTISAYTLAPYE